jgi:hypothetical protein
MKDDKRTQGEQLAIGTISVLRTLVDLDRVGATNLPLDDFVEAQRERGDERLADAIDAFRQDTGSVAAGPRRS